MSREPCPVACPQSRGLGKRETGAESRRLRILDNGDPQKVNDYKGKRSSAPSAGFEPATPGLGNRCSIP